MNLTEIDIIKPRSLDSPVANYPAELTMVYRTSRSDSKPFLRNRLECFIFAFGILMITFIFLPLVGISRETICRPTAANGAVCQHRFRSFLWLHLIENPPFQLNSAAVTTYQSLRSKDDSIEFYTAYQLDISGIQSNGKLQSVTMKSYGENQGQAYADLGRILDLRSGAAREPLTLGDSNALGVFVLLGIISWIGRRFGLWRYLTQPVRRTQQPVAETTRTDEPIRCRPATTWTEAEVEDESNTPVQPVNRRIDSLYSKSNKLN
jgi:hypothetical protein